MSSDPKTEVLLTSTAIARARVAADIERLAAQLAPEGLKQRALGVAKRSAESVAVRLLRRLAMSPRKVTAFAVKHPGASAAVAAGAVALLWRLVARPRR